MPRWCTALSLGRPSSHDAARAAGRNPSATPSPISRSIQVRPPKESVPRFARIAPSAEDLPDGLASWCSPSGFRLSSDTPDRFCEVLRHFGRLDALPVLLVLARVALRLRSCRKTSFFPCPRAGLPRERFAPRKSLPRASAVRPLAGIASRSARSRAGRLSRHPAS